MEDVTCAVAVENRCIPIGRRRWDRFAIENIAPELCADSIIGRTVRPPLNGFDFGALMMALKGKPDLPIVALCSYCQRLRRPGAGDDASDDDWVAAETYYRLGGTNRVRISHGLCADCDAVRF